jgi:hypothetical protein
VQKNDMTRLYEKNEELRRKKCQKGLNPKPEVFL